MRLYTMQRKPIPVNIVARRAAVWCLPIPLLWLGMPGVCKAQAEAQTPMPSEALNKVEPAPTSQLTGITLPPYALRLLDKRLLAQITPRLQQMAQQSKKRSVNPEVLTWSDSGFVGDNAPMTMNAVAAQVKKAGYAYVEKAMPRGLGRVVLAQKPGQQVGGFWLGTETSLMLAWSRMETPDGTVSSGRSDTTMSQSAPGDKSDSHRNNAPTSAATSATGGGSDAETAALQTITRIYKTEVERFHDLAHYDFAAAFAFYARAYTFTDGKGKVVHLKEQREGTEQMVRKMRWMRQEVRIEKAHLEGTRLEVTYRATVDAEVIAPDSSGITNHLHDDGLYRDTWQRTGNGWQLLSTLVLPDTTGSANKNGKPVFKQHVTQQEANMYRLMTTALSGRGYMANVDGGGVLACFNSVGARLCTLPPRNACSDEFQYYVEKSLTLQIKTQINLETSLSLRGGHRGFSNLLGRDAFFEGSNPNDDFNTLRFVYSDTRWD